MNEDLIDTTIKLLRSTGYTDNGFAVRKLKWLYQKEKNKNRDLENAKARNITGFDTLAETLVEKRYQLRVEHNHKDMKWYAYYAGKNSYIELFDESYHSYTAADTPTEALKNLKEYTK